MKTPPLTYKRVHSLEEAVSVLGQYGDDAKVLAGGQSLIPMLNFRLARPSVLVDIGSIPDLDYLRPLDGGGVEVGALTTHRRLEKARDSDALGGLPVIGNSAALIGHLPIRTRGTIGGSLAHADPASEWCILATLLDASVTVHGRAGQREVGAADLFRGFLTTDLAWDEVISSVRFPRRRPHAALVEYAPRHADFALVAAAAAVDIDGGICRDPRIVLGGVSSKPIRIAAAEAELSGRDLSDSTLVAAGHAAAEAIDPPHDVHAPKAYRRRLAAVLVKRALEAIRETIREEE